MTIILIKKFYFIDFLVERFYCSWMFFDEDPVGRKFSMAASPCSVKSPVSISVRVIVWRDLLIDRDGLPLESEAMGD